MKFKIGDRVKDKRFGKGTVMETEVGDDKELLLVKFDKKNTELHNASIWGKGYYEDCTCYYYKKQDNELELVTTTFTKSDLKDGDKCTLKNGKAVFYGGSSKYGSTYCFENLTDDFKYEHNDEVSIVKVERPTKYETVFERKEEILDNTEKNYLRSVIRPFRNEVKTIEKNIMDDKEYICINLKNWLDTFTLPRFKKGTMYKGMKKDKKYTLEELGL